MQLKHVAISGTLESSDVQVTIAPADQGIEFELDSSVIRQYGREIRQTTMEVLKNLGIENAKISIVDQGALDCTLRARIESAVFRACDVTEPYPWGGEIQA